jgi:hypothetical protein
MANLSDLTRLLLKNVKKTEVVCTIRGAASQSANLLEVQDSSKTVLFGISAAGAIAGSTFPVIYREKSSQSTQSIFLADAAYQVIAIEEVHSTAGSDGGTVTISFSKDTGTTAPGAGTGLVTAALSLKTTANTPQAATLSATAADLVMAAGDRLAVVYSGTLTALVGVVVVVTLKRL